MKKMDTTYWEEKKRKKNVENQRKELDAVIKLIRMLEKETGNVKTLKMNPRHPVLR